MRVFLVFSVIIFTAKGADWPNWRGPDHDGISKEQPPRSNFSKILWRKDIGVGFSSLAVSGGRVFALGCSGNKNGNKETFYCLSEETGKTLWQETYPAALVDYLHEGGPCASPTVDGKRVYGLSKSGRLVSYDIDSGKKHWVVDLMEKAELPRPPEWGFAASPLILGEILIVEATFTCALDKNTGKVSNRFAVVTVRSQISKMIGKKIVSKDEVFDNVKNYFKNYNIVYNRNNNVKKECYDEIDSIAVGLCFINKERNNG